MRVTQVGVVVDPLNRTGHELLVAWPTLKMVADAVGTRGATVSVVQASLHDERFEMDGVDYHFVRADSVHAGVAATHPDVIHFQGLVAPRAVARMCGAFGNVPMLVQDHGSRPPTGWRRPLSRWCFRRVKGFAFTAHAQGVPWQQAGIISRSVPIFEVLESSTSFAPGDREAARRVTGIFGDPCLVWTGRLDENKNPLLVLEALEHAAPHLPDARLWCCFGDAPLLDRVRTRIESSDVLRHRVVLLGRRPANEIEMYLRSADFFVQASAREGSGYALIEALACNVTPIVTDIPSFRAIAGDVGELVPVGDVSAFTNAILSAAGNRASSGGAARRRFTDALAPEHVGEGLMKAYRFIVEPHRALWSATAHPAERAPGSR